MDCFLYDRDLRHKRINAFPRSTIPQNNSSLLSLAEEEDIETYMSKAFPQLV